MQGDSEKWNELLSQFFLESKLFDSIENRFDVQKDKASGSLQSGLIKGF